MKTLYFLTTSFPFDDGEEFIENELPFVNGFDRLVIVPTKITQDSKITKNIPQNFEISPIIYRNTGTFGYIKLLFKKTVYKEILSLYRSKKLSKTNLHRLLFFAKNSYYIYNRLKKIIDKNEDYSIYTYWLYEAAFAAAILKSKRNIPFISRAHGFDVYHREYDYFPFRKFTLENIDFVYTCSENGRNQLICENKEFSNKIKTSYLGTAQGERVSRTNKPLHIISCSYMLPVKRIHFIAQALHKIRFPVKWTHIGDGECEDEIKRILENMPPNVTVELKGYVPAADISLFYKNNDISVFVNVSSSEGVPVSIMEAMSYSIPIIATDVGGISEAVDESLGMLLPKDLNSTVLAKSFTAICEMDTADYNMLCENSYNKWEKTFNCEKNYNNFYNKFGFED